MTTKTVVDRTAVEWYAAETALLTEDLAQFFAAGDHVSQGPN